MFRLHSIFSHRYALLTVLLALLALVACREKYVQEPAFIHEPRAETGTPRSYLLGFSALPSTLSNSAFIQALDLTAQYGDLLLIQRTPSWNEFVPDVVPSEQLHQLALREHEAVEARGLTLFYAIDPFDPSNRGRLAGLPPKYMQADLSNPDLFAAFVEEARFIATNYQPRYLALGIEVNATFEHDPHQYTAYLQAYRAAYEAVKEISPETITFATFQYEQLLGLVPWEPARPPRWELIQDFAGHLDLIAISTFPSITYDVARKVPPLYYSQIADHTTLPIAFAAVGFSSAPGKGDLNSSTPAEQRRYLQRLLADADEIDTHFLIWFAGRDPNFTIATSFNLLASSGLRDTNDRPKEAWITWEKASARPYVPFSDYPDVQ